MPYQHETSVHVMSKLWIQGWNWEILQINTREIPAKCHPAVIRAPFTHQSIQSRFPNPLLE
jgi:hypothetical protein